MLAEEPEDHLQQQDRQHPEAGCRKRNRRAGVFCCLQRVAHAHEYGGGFWGGENAVEIHHLFRHPRFEIIRKVLCDSRPDSASFEQFFLAVIASSPAQC
jgi:hypothetical protein